jgi:hypothetical protein
LRRLREEVGIQKVVFHPGAARENQLLVLTTDGVINLYSVTDESSRIAFVSQAE